MSSDVDIFFKDLNRTIIKITREAVLVRSRVRENRVQFRSVARLNFVQIVTWFNITPTNT